MGEKIIYISLVQLEIQRHVAMVWKYAIKEWESRSPDKFEYLCFLNQRKKWKKLREMNDSSLYECEGNKTWGK